MTIYVVIDNGSVVKAYANEADAVKMVKACNMAEEMGGGYPKAHYEAVDLDELEG